VSGLTSIGSAHHARALLTEFFHFQLQLTSCELFDDILDSGDVRGSGREKRNPGHSNLLEIATVGFLKRGSDTPRLIGFVALYSPMPDKSPSNRLEVAQPTRGADRNRSITSHPDPATDDVLLPSLDDGITLLDVDGSRGVPILQSLVLDHLLMHDGPAFWVDANGHATTTTLSRIAPSQRLLNRIHVARGFTAYQHYSAVCDLPATVNHCIQESTTRDNRGGRRATDSDGETSPHTPSLIVAPAVDAQYRTDDTLGEAHAETLKVRALAKLTTYAEGYDIPVLVTRSKRDEFTSPVATVADQHLECEQTQMGPRISGEDFETRLYPVDDGTYYQTTFAYWRQLLAARATQVGVAPTTTPSTSSTEGVGTGVTADGETVSVAASPLLDAWTDASTGGR